MKNVFVLFMLLSLTTAISEGQILILKNKKSLRSVIFIKGANIVYKEKDKDREWKSGRIDAFDSTHISINGHSIATDRIAAIEVERKGFNFGGCGGTFFLVGFLLPTMSVFNDFINADKIILSRGQLIVTVSFLAAGIILWQLSVKKCVIGKKYSLQILL